MVADFHPSHVVTIRLWSLDVDDPDRFEREWTDLTLTIGAAGGVVRHSGPGVDLHPPPGGDGRSAVIIADIPDGTYAPCRAAVIEACRAAGRTRIWWLEQPWPAGVLKI